MTVRALRSPALFLDALRTPSDQGRFTEVHTGPAQASPATVQYELGERRIRFAGGNDEGLVISEYCIEGKSLAYRHFSE